MNSNTPFPLLTSYIGRQRCLLSLLALFLCGNAWAAYQDNRDIDIQNCPPPPAANCASPNVKCYSALLGTKMGQINEDISAIYPNDVSWFLTKGFGCSGSAPSFTCAGMVVTVPSSTDPKKVHISNASDLTTAGISQFNLKASDPGGQPSCDYDYLLSVTATGGGWGDPHITTVDGIHYDFQSAGEFTALRGDGLEIQTRQTPIATTFLPGANDYTGLKTCVALYSAVATSVCNHRISYQPNISGVPDPSGMQLRVDGVLTNLTSEGIGLSCDSDDSPSAGERIAGPITGARIVKSPAGDGIEVHYSDGTQLVVTPNYWADQQKWYLNVNVYGTTASAGIFGQLAKDSWLPALADGTSLGPKPESLPQRYVELYGKFADAWRVTDATSLFDYAPGTSTATFTFKDWPRDNPKSCDIEGEASAQPVDVAVAEQHCSSIVDKQMRDDCIFDVAVTGFPGFAQTYQVTEQLQPGATTTSVKSDKDPTKYGEKVSFTAVVAAKLPTDSGVPSGTVQFIVDGGKVGSVVTLASNAQAIWSTSDLPVGEHRIVAQYTPTGWGGLFTASHSQEQSHTVVGSHKHYFSLIAVLIVILIVLMIWVYRRKK